MAHIADFIRLSLLEKYGGIWVDASIFLTEDFNWFLKRLKDEDVFLFFSDECTLDLKTNCRKLVYSGTKGKFIYTRLAF